MRHLYLLSLFFCFFNVSAQLNILSSHTDITCFFDKDGVLFIEDDIHLEKKTPKDISKINLNISFNELYTRQLILVFREDATTSVDHAVDAKNFEALASDAAWLIDDEAYVRIVLPFFKEQKLPISISLENKGTIKISMEKVKNLPADKIFLFDAKENFYQDLKSLNFIAELPAGNYNDRFYLVFTEEIKEPEIANPLDEDFPKRDMLVSYDEKLHQVEILAKDFLDHIELYDLTGGLILTKRIYDNQQYYYFYTGKLKEAGYIIKIKTRGNIYYNTKINLKK